MQDLLLRHRQSNQIRSVGNTPARLMASESQIKLGNLENIYLQGERELMKRNDSSQALHNRPLQHKFINKSPKKPKDQETEEFGSRHRQFISQLVLSQA
jgi:hypothetical protein